MDCEKLIELVREREELYDTKQINYRNKEFNLARNNMWKDIADQLGTTDIEAKNKWHNLRSNFMRERRKLKAVSASGAEGVKVSWPYFRNMWFLDDSLRTSENEGIISDESEEVSVEVSHWDSNEVVESRSPTPEENRIRCDGLSDRRQSEMTNFNRNKKRKQLTVENDRQHFHQLEDHSSAAEDPDLMFFKSLLPQIKKLNLNENLSFKVEVAQLLLNKLHPTADRRFP